MTSTKTLALGTFLASTLLAGSAFAKAHDQSATNGGAAASVWTTAPGEAAREETAAAAQTLGAGKGNSTNAPGRNK